MDLSAAEEYAVKIIAAENTLQHSECGITSAVASGLALPDGLWPSVCAELKAQSVIGYPANAVETLGLSPAEQAEYLALAGKNLSSWYRLMSAQDGALGAFRQADIPVAVLKGAAAATNYPHPNNRSMGDIDLIVPPDHFEQAFSLMERLGWKNDIVLEINPRHAGFEKAGCPEIELHRHFSTCTNKQQAHFLDQAIYDAIPRAEWTDVAGFSVPVLPPLENGLVLLAHVNQHLGSGLGAPPNPGLADVRCRPLDRRALGERLQACGAAGRHGEARHNHDVALPRAPGAPDLGYVVRRRRRAACRRPFALRHAQGKYGAKDGARCARDPNGAAQLSQPHCPCALFVRRRARPLGPGAQVCVACPRSVHLSNRSRHPQRYCAQCEPMRTRQ